MNIEMIKEFIEWAEDVPYVEVFEGVWQIGDEGYEVHFQLDSNMDFEYSVEVLAGNILRKDGLVVMNIDNGCGETTTMVFLESEEVT